MLGSRGFLGTHVVDALRTWGRVEVVEGVRHPPERRTEGVVTVDLAQGGTADIRRLLNGIGPRIIVNCAGRTVGSAAELVVDNALSVARLVDALESLRGRVRLVHLGSAAEYGRSPTGVPVRESATAQPLSAYGISKLAATQLLSLAREHGAVDATVLRVFNAIGPQMPPHTLPGAVLPKLLEATASGATSVETGPLDAVRDFVDVRDVARAVVAACRASELPPPIINIGSGYGRSARELVAELARLVGYSGSIVETAPGSPRSVDVPWQVADLSEARRALAWHPIHDLTAMCDLATAREVLRRGRLAQRDR